VKVSEGLVLASDSTATLQGAIKDPSGKEATGILKTYDHARKLSHLKDYPIGTLTWGTYLVGPRSVESLIKEYEYTLPSLVEEEEKARGARLRGESPPPFTFDVKSIASGLLAHVQKAYNAEFGHIAESSRPPLGLLVSGYSSSSFFPDQWVLAFPGLTQLQELRPDVNGKPHFGANWFGLTDAIVRLHWGRDDAALEILAKRFSVTVDEARVILEPLQYPVPFEGMPLQDAIDYAAYLINVVIGRFRFVIGAPICGGEIDIAVVTPNAFSWVSRKTWKL
jgi:hypothetical protein